MRQVGEIKAAYDWMIEAYQSEVSEAMQRNDTGAVESLEMKRDILERGVFVVLFGQFENAVTEYFEQARDARNTNSDWTSRRGWDVPAYSGRKVQFESKLALTLDRNRPEHGKVLAAYAQRNHNAHGGTSEPVGAIGQFVDDLYIWQSLLRS